MAWATATEALAAWALAVAVDVAASTGWAMAQALEVMDVAPVLEALALAAVTVHCSLEDVLSPASTKLWL